MKYKLKLLQPVKAENDFGEEVDTWQETVTVHAERVKHTGNRSEEVGEHFPPNCCTRQFSLIVCTSLILNSTR